VRRERTKRTLPDVVQHLPAASWTPTVKNEPKQRRADLAQRQFVLLMCHGQAGRQGSWWNNPKDFHSCRANI
jgi:hypothetical protein